MPQTQRLILHTDKNRVIDGIPSKSSLLSCADWPSFCSYKSHTISLPWAWYFPQHAKTSHSEGGISLGDFHHDLPHIKWNCTSRSYSNYEEERGAYQSFHVSKGGVLPNNIPTQVFSSISLTLSTGFMPLAVSIPFSANPWHVLVISIFRARMSVYININNRTMILRRTVSVSMCNILFVPTMNMIAGRSGRCTGECFKDAP